MAENKKNSGQEPGSEIEESEIIQEPEPTLSESFQLALDQLKRSADAEKKINIVIPETIKKIGVDDPQEIAEGNAILTTLVEDDNETVVLALADNVTNWASVSPKAAGKGAVKMALRNNRLVNIRLAENLEKWIDLNFDAAEEVAETLAKYKGMGVNLALADNLPHWAEHHAVLTGETAIRIIKGYNHFHAVTNLLEKTYGKDWRKDVEKQNKTKTKKGERSLIDDLFLKAGEHVRKIRLSIASGLPSWAGHNPEDAEEVVSILVEEIKLKKNKFTDEKVNEALLESMSQLAEDHPKTTARLATVMITNPDNDTIDSIIDMLKENLNVDPSPVYEAIEGIKNYHGKEELATLMLNHNKKGEKNLLDDLGL